MRQNTAEFYEKLEDGLITLPPVPKTIDYKLPDAGATRDELVNERRFAKQQAVNSKYKIDKTLHPFWIAVVAQLDNRIESAPRLPPTEEQLLAREAQRIHDEYEMAANVRK